MSTWDMVLFVASAAVARLLVEGDGEEGTEILVEAMAFIYGVPLMIDGDEARAGK